VDPGVGVCPGDAIGELDRHVVVDMAFMTSGRLRVMRPIRPSFS
jgi:hypothetical protein